MINLIRFTPRPDATLGILLINDFPFCATLEEPWRENKPNVSCIPAATYSVEWLHSMRFDKFLPRLKAVPGRDAILLHSGNHDGHTEGCILLGAYHEIIDGQPWVMRSRDTFREFELEQKLKPFELKIVWGDENPEGILKCDT